MPTIGFGVSNWLEFSSGRSDSSSEIPAQGSRGEESSIHTIPATGLCTLRDSSDCLFEEQIFQSDQRHSFDWGGPRFVTSSSHNRA
jgi:hypothetical protein